MLKNVLAKLKNFYKANICKNNRAVLVVLAKVFVTPWFESA